MDVLADLKRDLIKEGYTGEKLEQEFIYRKKQLWNAVTLLIEEATIGSNRTTVDELFENEAVPTAPYKKDKLLILMAHSKSVNDKFVCVEGSGIGRVAYWDMTDEGILKINGTDVSFYFSYKPGVEPDQWILIEGEQQ
jgi:hypothetical protein